MKEASPANSRTLSAAVAILAALFLMFLLQSMAVSAGVPAPISMNAQPAANWPPPYRVAILQDISTTNYWAYLGPSSNVWNAYVLDQPVETLFALSDRRNDLIPRLAADFGSAPVLQGDLWAIEVPLKQGIRWSDGTGFTAQDVVFTLETCANLELGGNWITYCPEILDHVVATGPYTVTFYFTEMPGIGQWQAGVARTPVLPRHYWEPIVNEATAQPDPADYLYSHVPIHEPVLGPFMLNEWQPGSHVELLPNPLYYFQGLEVTHYANGAYRETLPGVYTFTAYGAASGPVDLRLTVGPHVGSVRYSIYAGQEGAYQALLDGDVDLVLNPFVVLPEYRDMLEADPDITIVLNQDYGLYYMAFNLRKPVLDLLEFREAVATLVDRDFPGTIVAESTDPLYTFMPPGNAFWYNPAVPRIGEGLSRQARIDGAVSLLSSAGFTWTVQPAWDPVGQQVLPGHGLHYGGQPVPEIELLAPNFDYDPIRATEALSIEQWLNEAGISVTAVLTDASRIYGPVFGSASFDTYILGWGLGNVAFPNYFDSFWHSRNDTLTSGNSNTPGYNNPLYDALCDDFMATSDLDQARADAFQMQEILATDLPYLTLHTKHAFDAYYNNRMTFPYTDTLGGLQQVRGLPDLVRFLAVTGTVATEGGTVHVPIADATFRFPAGAVSETVLVSFTVAFPSPTGDLLGAGPFFDLSAVYAGSGNPAQIEPGAHYTVELAYADLGPVVEDSLGLYWWDEGLGQWSQDGIVNTVDSGAKLVTAEVDHFSRFALLGETNWIYLPVVLRGY